MKWVTLVLDQIVLKIYHNGPRKMGMENIDVLFECPQRVIILLSAIVLEIIFYRFYL